MSLCLLLGSDHAVGLDLTDARPGLRLAWARFSAGFKRLVWPLRQIMVRAGGPGDHAGPSPQRSGRCHVRRAFMDSLRPGPDGVVCASRHVAALSGQSVTVVIDSPDEEVHWSTEAQFGIHAHKATLAPGHDPSPGPVSGPVSGLVSAIVLWLSGFRVRSGRALEHQAGLAPATRQWVDQLVASGMQVRGVYLLSSLAVALVPDRGAWLVVLGGGARVRHVLIEHRRVCFVRHVLCRDDEVRCQALEETLAHLQTSAFARPSWSVLCVGVGAAVLEGMAELGDVGRLQVVAVDDAGQLPVDAAAWHLLQLAARGIRHGSWRQSPWQAGAVRSRRLQGLKAATLAGSMLALTATGFAIEQVLHWRSQRPALEQAMSHSAQRIEQMRIESLELHPRPELLHRVVAEAARQRELLRDPAREVSGQAVRLLEVHPELILQSLSWASIGQDELGLSTAPAPILVEPVLKPWQSESPIRLPGTVLELTGLVAGGYSLRRQQKLFDQFMSDLSLRWPGSRWQVDQAPVDVSRRSPVNVDSAGPVDLPPAPFALRVYLPPVDSLDV